MKTIIDMSKKELEKLLWSEDPKIMEILLSSNDVLDARNQMFLYLNSLERQYFNVLSPTELTTHHIIERENAKECVRVLKNVIRTENEKLTGISALQHLRDLACNGKKALSMVSKGFICEMIFLFRGINGSASIASNCLKEVSHEMESRSVSERSRQLNNYARRLQDRFERYRTGLAPYATRRRAELRKRIIKFRGGGVDDWDDYRWHFRNIFSSVRDLAALVHLDRDEVAGLTAARKLGIPVHVTPYYLSLFNQDGRCDSDRGLRAHVLPSVRYCEAVAAGRRAGQVSDFMGEKHTSPVEGITRRYPQIAILKPFNSCPQICVYCQRNWEVHCMATASCLAPAKLKRALEWINRNKSLREILVTGGDPLTLGNAAIDELLSALSNMKHIERIRIGTRTPVTVPCRINDVLVDIIDKHHKWGTQEIAVMTHVEYPAEITDEFQAAILRLKRIGVNVYNQQVYTYYTSRRYEACFLRRNLKLCGVDPYYTFNTKGKDETVDFRVPMARLQQERHEEARLMPGLVRTDEPVFNVPLQGKSSLVAWQDHEPIMILPDGRRVYRFYPWESRLAFADDYLYTDVSIYDYLARLSEDGERVEDYMSIWYYF